MNNGNPKELSGTSKTKPITELDLSAAKAADLSSGEHQSTVVKASVAFHS